MSRTNETTQLSVMIVDDEPLARERLRRLLSELPEVIVVSEAADAHASLEAIATTKVDVALLDVRMPGVDGIELAERLAPLGAPGIIFVSAHTDRAIDAFRVNALDYLLKPVEPSRLASALDRARDSLGRAANRDRGVPELAEALGELLGARATLRRIVVRETGRTSVIRVSEIDWIEGAGNYARIHFGKSSLLHREPLHSLEAKLDPTQFCRISRSAIVNLDCVRELQHLFHGDHSVHLRDGTRVTLTRNHRIRFEAALSGRSASSGTAPR